MSLSSDLSRIHKLQKQGKKIVFTNGCFDLIHAGHVRYLNQAKSYGDVLVVALNSDASVKRLKGRGRPILPLRDRMEMMSGLKCVDFVVSFGEDTPARLIKQVQPDVLIKGGDWAAGNIVGKDTVQKRGGKVVSGLFVRGKSTTAIIQKIKNGR